MTSVVISAICAAAVWYLAAHAEIFRGIQEKYPAWLDRLVSCPACLGFWAGGATALACRLVAGWSWLGLGLWPGAAAAAIVSIWTTPILGAIQLAAIGKIHRISTGAE